MRSCKKNEDSSHQIVEVWANNLESEFYRIREVVERFPYVALDTEFPGIVARPSDTAAPEYNYRTVKCNVDLLKVIQLGITFADASGNVASNPSTWQFNFKFDMTSDMYAQDSIDFLKESGVDFERLQKSGVEFHNFGELMISSGLVMNDDVKWISFHGCYDFGYLLKLLTCQPLPECEDRFFELLTDFFPALYDIKFLLKNSKSIPLMGGNSLQRLAEHFNVARVGRQHQAGSDSLVTCRTFFRLLESYFGNRIDDSKFSGIIYGLGCFGGHRCGDPDESAACKRKHRGISLDVYSTDDSASDSVAGKARPPLSCLSPRRREERPPQGRAAVLAADQALRQSLSHSIFSLGMSETGPLEDDSQRASGPELKVLAR